MQQSQHLCPSAPVTLLHGDYRWECRNSINPEPEAQVVSSNLSESAILSICCEEVETDLNGPRNIDNPNEDYYSFYTFNH